MPDIDQTLLAQQRQERELNEARRAAQNEEAREAVPGVSIAQATEARETKKQGPVTEDPEEMAATLRAEQIEAQNQEAAAAEQSKAAKDKSAMDQVQQLQKAAKAAQGTARTVNFTSAASLIGLVITFVVMNTQLIGGNIFGAKWIPKLEIWEAVLIGVVDFLLWLTIMASIGIISAIVSPVS